MKFASLALASTLLFASIAPTTQAQTTSQYQHQLHRAVCQNNWTEALGIVRMLMGAEQTTPQQRQQLIAFRNQLEQYRASNAAFDRRGDAACAAAIAAAPHEAAALQAPSPVRRPVQPAISHPAIARTPQPAVRPSAAVPMTIEQGSAIAAAAYCQARRSGMNRDTAIEQSGEAVRQYLVDRYGLAAGQAYIEYVRANVPQFAQQMSASMLEQCPELFRAN